MTDSTLTALMAVLMAIVFTGFLVVLGVYNYRLF